MVHTWAKDYSKYNGDNVEPVPIFLSSSRDSDKSDFVEVIENVLLKTLSCPCEETEKSKALLLGLTWISAVFIVWTTIHSGLEIKRGTKLLGLMEVTFLVKDDSFCYQVIYEQILIPGCEKDSCWFPKKPLLVFESWL